MFQALRKRLSPLGNMYEGGGGAADQIIARIRRPFDRAYLQRASRLHDVRALAGTVATARPPTGKTRSRVIVCALRGIPDHNAYEALIALGLAARGAEVAILTCGGGLPICEQGYGRKSFPRPCDRCAWQTRKLAQSLGVRHFKLIDQLEWSTAGDAPSAPPPSEVDPARCARVSAVWSLKAAAIEEQPDGPEVFQDYTVTSAAAAVAAAAILDEFRPDAVVLLNGMFAPEHAIREVARQRGIRTPTYEIAPRAGALVLSQTGCAPEFEMDRIWEAVGATPLTASQSAVINAMLEGRTRGIGAHERYAFADASDTAAIGAALGLAPGTPLAALFSNIAWDSALQGKDGAYVDMLDFVTDAVSHASDLPGHHLVVRSHPAEVKWGTREPVEPAIRSRLGVIPPNVTFVGAGDPLDSYALVRASDFVLSYGTTLGLEAAAIGVPAVVASRVHYAGRGFTTDLATRADLPRVFSAPPSAMTADEVELARRYAFAFFFRGMVSFPGVTRDHDGTVAALPTSAAALTADGDPFLDFVCDRILDGSEFFPGERLIDLETQLQD